MRVLLVSPGPQYSVQDVFVGIGEGLETCGAKVGRLNLADRLAFYTSAMLEREGEYIHAFDFDAGVFMATRGILAACYDFRPDAVVFVSGFFVDETLCEAIRANGTVVAIVHTESPYEDDKQARRAEWVDVNVVNDPTNLNLFPAHTAYLPHAYRPAVHHPGASRMDPLEFCFVGTGYPSRAEFFEKVDFDGIAAGFFGNWANLDSASPLQQWIEDNESCLDNELAADVYRASLTSCNLYRRETNDPVLGAGWAVGPREVELAACGIWFARDPRGESDELFGMLPTFTTPDELGEQIRWALHHPAERDGAARKARHRIADRTFNTYARTLLQMLDQPRKKDS